MIPLVRATQLDLVAEARRAPSVHNIQPACWRFLPEGGIELWRDTRRALPVADPRGNDVMLSLGAAWEGMSLALKRRGVGFGEVSFASGGGDRFARVAHAGIVSADRADRADGVDMADRVDGVDMADKADTAGTAGTGEFADPLLDAVFERVTWRGVFLPQAAEDAARLVSALTTDNGVYWLQGEAQIGEIASLYDACSWEFMRRADYYAELFAWMRLDKDHPEWPRDGLNAQALAMSRLERFLAGWVMRPPVMNVLVRAGIARALVSEAAQIRSATAIAVLATRPGETAFAAGRRFYRNWLELTAAGFALCPMSAITDSPHGQAELRRHCGLPADTPLLNAWRVGKAPPGRAVPTPRLPAEELLLD